jgi:hypothetical protein
VQEAYETLVALHGKKGKQDEDRASRRRRRRGADRWEDRDD